MAAKPSPPPKHPHHGRQNIQCGGRSEKGSGQHRSPARTGTRCFPLSSQGKDPGLDWPRTWRVGISCSLLVLLAAAWTLGTLEQKEGASRAVLGSCLGSQCWGTRWSVRYAAGRSLVGYPILIIHAPFPPSHCPRPFSVFFFFFFRSLPVDTVPWLLICPSNWARG